MILVLAPDHLAEESPESTEPIEGDNDLTAASFADVDDLLAGIDATAKLPRAASPTAPKRPQPARATTQPPVDATSSAMDAARQPWDNPAATAMRRRLAWTAGIVGGLLLVVAAVTAWTLRPSDPPGAVVNRKENAVANKLPPTANSASPVDDDADAAEVNVDDSTGSTRIPPASDSPPASRDASPTTNNSAIAITGSTPPPLDIPPPTPSILGTSANPARPTDSLINASTSNSPGSTPKGNPTSEAPGAPPSPTAGVLKPVAAAESSLAELAALLEQSGSSIGQITDATAGSGSEESIGLPKYFFRTKKAQPIDLTRQLQLPCDGIRCRQTSLSQILREITRISGVPITLDLSNLPTPTTGSLIPVLDLDISATDIGGAIERCVSPLGLAATVTESSVIIRASDATTATQRTYDLGSVASLGDVGLERLRETIKAMIGGDSWFVDAERFQITRQDRQLIVTHVPRIHAQIAAFLEKASAAIALSIGAPAPAAHHATLQTRLGRAAALRRRPSNLPITNRGALDDLLDRVDDHAGVQIVANWRTLAPLGWTPLTSVPGNVTEPTIGELLDQFERSLNARAIIIDSTTAELTTRDDALQRTGVEFYFIADLFQQRFTPERVLQLVQEAIAGSPGGRHSLVVYEPPCQSMIVSAPQTTHRAIESVLAQVRRLDAGQTP